MHTELNEEEIEKLYEKLMEDAEASGYHLNPDIDFTKGLVKGLLVNGKRYGYQSCPCRLAADNKKEDMDIMCLRDYRDADLNEYGTCYCGLYVSQVVLNGERKIEPIPERRSPREKREKIEKSKAAETISSLQLPVWRCRACGYLCAREEPPEICPICKAEKKRFEKFL